MSFKKIIVLLTAVMLILCGCVQKNILEKETKTRKETKAIQKNEKTSYTSPVSYSDLSFYGENKAFIPSESTTQGLATGDIAPFYESFTKDCAFIEGRVTSLYEKTYEYSVRSSKFSENDRAYCYTVSVIYEFEIERVWSGDFTAGEKILIEDMQLFCGEQFYMNKGHKYLIPIRDVGEDIAILALNADTAEGETKRQTPYSTEYPYHPQIEKTADGYYFFSDDWTTLASEKAIKVENVDFEYGSVYYRDKMLLLDSKSFEENIKKMLLQ
ncbi:MAG: hypothetical protein E7591_01270 [Ruminococcaceae bacterium]|nr:hypothetical protein [Oscillospiraceae bacterium]